MSEVKTLPEILKPVYAGTSDDDSVTEAQEAIAKELMGCLPEKNQSIDDSGLERDLLPQERMWNQALDEVRARLTAFIGHKEK